MEVAEVETMTAILQAEVTTACLLVETMEVAVLGMTVKALVDLEVRGTTSPHRKCVHDSYVLFLFSLFPLFLCPSMTLWYL